MSGRNKRLRGWRLFATRLVGTALILLIGLGPSLLAEVF